MNENLQKAFALHKENKLDAAEKYYLQAINEDCNDYRICNLLGKLYIEQKKYENAINILKKGIGVNDQICDLWFDLGLAERNNNNWEESKKAYNKAIEINPKMNEAYFNLAYLYFNDSEPYEAVKCYEKAMELSPDIDTMYFLSLAYMQTKNYDKGLEYFESRLCRASSVVTQEKTYPKLATQDRIWQGEDISDKTIYTYYEAGFGDVIMFARYLPLLQKRCKKIIFKPQRQLVPLFRDNFPDIEVLDLFKEQDRMHFDVHLPMLSLPYAMGLKGEEVFSGHEKYLKSNPQRVARFKKDYFDNDKFKVGIKWQGNTFYDVERVIKIENFFNIMQLPNTKFYSCQTFEGSEEYDKIPKEFGVVNMANAFADFADTAAAIENMDLVICNDTSLAHVAGALGKPCWVILPHVYNWRWHVDLSKCDWYDSVKIFRQETQGDWNKVFAAVEEELKRLLL